MRYYDERKKLIEDKEVNDRIRRLDENNETLRTYYKIGKLLVEARGGETRAKYDNGLIKEWLIKLTKKYGKGYSSANLKHIRKFYLIFRKSEHTVFAI